MYIWTIRIHIMYHVPYVLWFDCLFDFSTIIAVYVLSIICVVNTVLLVVVLMIPYDHPLQTRLNHTYAVLVLTAGESVECAITRGPPESTSRYRGGVEAEGL